MNPDLDDVLDKCIEAVISNKMTLEQCLNLHKERRAELEPMLIAALRVSALGEVVPDTKKKQEARNRLLSAVEQKRWETGIGRVVAYEKSAKGSPRWRTAFMKLAVIAVAFVLLSSTTIALAKNSLPGSPLYPVKIAVEKARIGLTKDNGKKAELYLNAAKERMAELRRLKREDPHYLELIKAMANNIKMAKDLSANDSSEDSNDKLDDFIKENRESLETVLDQAPSDAKPVIEHTLENKEDNDNKAEDKQEDNSDKDKNDGKLEPNSKLEDSNKQAPSKIQQPETERQDNNSSEPKDNNSSEIQDNSPEHQDNSPDRQEINSDNQGAENSDYTGDAN